MNGAKVVQLILVIALVAGAYFLGRNSTSPTEEKQPPPESAARPARLSAINPSAGDQNEPVRSESDPRRQGADTPTGTSRDQANASKISATLAEAAADVDDLLALAGTLAAWMSEDPDGAIAWLATSERRDDVLRVLFAVWGEDQPDAAAAWLAANQNLAGYDSAAVGLALSLSLSQNNKAATALELSDSVTDPVARLQIWETAGGQLYLNDQDGLRQRLASTDIPSDLQAGIIKKWKLSINDRAKRNAQNLASIYSAAIAAGATFKGQTDAEIVAELADGIMGADSFSTTTFQAPNIEFNMTEQALRNLTLDDAGTLNYDPVDPDDL